ncbi:uncharacterized protein MELLADRAFT_84098 [Melampsora larici-populina 98AG31]|uniref:Uncharacterized protein n=1 Tax=Melampsora larici-populina (strain 98AG31 / pathotype 3-4-7) TaxID=747676 RepID=F4SBH6_MELLP|nr:uncharacterized protein MELLADRAFT_84098 [Melampsora larici-populina 98AG31]EGF98002.1 hypothetical protein MELLADRAFT_84098 [Melampsora larici-populina 98AG31]
MPSQPPPTSVSSRALRIQRRDGLRFLAEQNPGDSQNKPVKRKNETDSDSNETASKKRAVKQIGARGKTTRERLLDILDEKHVKKRKPRTSRPSIQSTSKAAIQETPSNQHEVAHPIIQPSSNINYEQFSDVQLNDMLKIVGLDTSGFDRKALLQNCNAYTELIDLPSDSQKQFGQHPIHSELVGYQFNTPIDLCTPHVSQAAVAHSTSIETPTTITPEAGSSTTFLPSLEHKRLLYPRPHPTILQSTSSSAPKKGKGKAKATIETSSTSDWHPEDDEMDESHTDLNIGEIDSSLPSPSATTAEQGFSSAQQPAPETHHEK